MLSALSVISRFEYILGERKVSILQVTCILGTQYIKKYLYLQGLIFEILLVKALTLTICIFELFLIL